MPDENNPQSNTQKPLEVDVSDKSLKNYEVATMSKDVTSVPPTIPGERPSYSPPHEKPKEPTPQETPEKKEKPLDMPKVATPPPVSTPSSAPEQKPKEEPAPAAQSQLPPDLFDEEDEEKGSGLKRFLVGFIAILLLGGIGFGAYYWFVLNPQATPPPITPPTTPPPPPQLQFDTPLIPVNRTLPLDIAESATRQELFNTMREAIVQVDNQTEDGDLIRLYLHDNGTKLSLDNIQTILGLTSSGVETYIDGESYTLLYQKGAQTKPFIIVAQILNQESLQNALPQLEAGLVGALQELYPEYTQSALPQMTSENFMQTTYGEVEIRYMNFGSPELALDYGIHEDLLIIAGSKDAMFAAIDRAQLN